MAYDNLDRRLIHALQENGRASKQDLAKKLDVSVTTVSYHLNDLEEKGVITGYSPNINYEQLGFDVTAVLNISVSGELSTAVEQLRMHDQLVSVYETTGDYDVIAIGKFSDTDEMNAEIKTILGYTGIEESNTSVALNSEENQVAGLSSDTEVAAPSAD